MIQELDGIKDKLIKVKHYQKYKEKKKNLIQILLFIQD